MRSTSRTKCATQAKRQIDFKEFSFNDAPKENGFYCFLKSLRFLNFASVSSGVNNNSHKIQYSIRKWVKSTDLFKTIVNWFCNLSIYRMSSTCLLKVVCISRTSWNLIFDQNFRTNLFQSSWNRSVNCVQKILPFI